MQLVESSRSSASKSIPDSAARYMTALDQLEGAALAIQAKARHIMRDLRLLPNGGVQERLRPPLPNEPQRIFPDEIVVIGKRTKFELDQQCLHKTPEELIAWYNSEGANTEKILASHETQMESRRAIERYLHSDQILWREDYTAEVAAKAKLVIALGGDNHFQYVSHLVRDGYILGMNSDPGRSHGGLCPFKPGDLGRILQQLEDGTFQIEEWQRLQGTINGAALPPVISEFLVGELERPEMTRYVLSHAGRTEEQKSSGLLVSTGAGSTGWYSAAVKYLHRYNFRFPRTAERARFVATEPFGDLGLISGEIKPGEILKVKSLNDSNGVVRCDCIEEFPFQRGAELEITLAAPPLKVVSLSSIGSAGEES